MADRQPHGYVCWLELGTTDLRGAVEFYAPLMRWKVEESPIDDQHVYGMFHRGGKYAAAAYELFGDQRKQGVPPHWLTYFAVDSADEAVEKAKALGGTVIHGPTDVFEAGRMALIQDPGRAMFAVWEARKHPGITLWKEHGTWGWSELQVHSVEQVIPFYEGLFGWKTREMEAPDGIYYVFESSRGHQVAGMMAIRPEWGEVPPHWEVHFRVDDPDAFVEEGKKRGATILVPPMKVGDALTFAVLRDPQGALFSIVTYHQGS